MNASESKQARPPEHRRLAQGASALQLEDEHAGSRVFAGTPPTWLSKPAARKAVASLARDLLPGLAAGLDVLGSSYRNLAALLRTGRGLEGLESELHELDRREDDAAFDGYLLGTLASAGGVDLLRERRCPMALRHLARRARELWGPTSAPPPEDLPLTTPEGSWPAVLVPAFAFQAAASSAPTPILRREDSAELGPTWHLRTALCALPHPPVVTMSADGLHLPEAWLRAAGG